jgi:nitroreductase/NAD-dependent dihydropyrimidine dehydrogenase PreA subunit
MKPARLDQSLCDACGLCMTVCGRGMFFESDGVIEYRPGETCLDCGHCLAVCPEGALVHAGGDVPPPVEEEIFPDADTLLHLMRSRRSCRLYRKGAPPRGLLERLVEAARYAPTGSNRQAVNLVFVTDPGLIDVMRTKIMDRYGDYERHLNNPVKRVFLKYVVDRRLGSPKIRGFLKTFMDSWRGGRDVLFHGAPAVALLYAGPDASTPRDDCCIALYQMVLLAERLGLGSCLLGTVDTIFSRTRGMNELVGIPRGRPVLAAASFGLPAIRFHRLAARKELSVTWH